MNTLSKSGCQLRRNVILVSTSCAVLLVAVFSAFAQPAASPGPGDAGCVVLAAEGKVEFFRFGATAWLPAQTNVVLKPKDRLRTGFKSRASLRLSNQTVMRVNQLTTLEIQPPAAANKTSLLDLREGALYLFNRDQPGQVEFRTPQASGAIRGTEFNLEVTPSGETVLTMIDGVVELGNTAGAATLTSGEQATVRENQAPSKTSGINALNIIQWCLYYPGVLNLAELGLDTETAQALRPSIEAYQKGNLPQAARLYPDDRVPANDAERVYRAALLLAMGQVTETEKALQPLAGHLALAESLQRVIAAVKFQPHTPTNPPALASQWLAESYYQQSLSRLPEALNAARNAANRAPQFGFAWARVAELEFSFGRTAPALEALDQAMQLTPENAQAVALHGFLLAARNQMNEAKLEFDRAIALDPALGNAWLGRGLCLIHAGESELGRQDLQTAALLEPHRAIYRSYLGKAYSQTKDSERTHKELALAQKLDPKDPTSWLYLALLQQRENRINPAIKSLETSQNLNTNRSVFRSRLLLDQDQAVRSANLAGIYRDAGLFDVSVREATKAVANDYANYSAHLFLAESYDALRDPRYINLRYETPWLSELLLANLLAPVGASTLSQHVSQQEYSRLFQRDGLGAISTTEYLSRGDWIENASQFGTFGRLAYSLDLDHRTENGERLNSDLSQTIWWTTLKYQLTHQDTLLFQTLYYDFESGDVGQYYNPYGDFPGSPPPNATQRITEKQEPNLFAGYHHAWSPASHTLFYAGRLQDTLTRRDPNTQFRVVSIDAAGNITRVNDYLRPGGIPNNLEYERKLEAYSAELQQIYQHEKHTLVGGARYQIGWPDTTAKLARPPNVEFPVFLQVFDVTQQSETDLQRVSLYAYHSWQIWEPFQITAGLSYDRLDYPSNVDIAPISENSNHKDQVSPKAGFLWTPWKNGAVRGAFTRSLGGLYYDTSVRLEPTQVAGLNQTFRSLVPESVAGLVPGTEFQTWGLSFEQRFPTHTYLIATGELLQSDASRGFGVFQNYLAGGRPLEPGEIRNDLQFEEKTLSVTLNQLAGDYISLGAQYRISHADLQERFPDVPPGATLRPVGLALNRDLSAVLQQVRLFTIASHPCGAFGQIESTWHSQSNQGYQPDIPGDDFWQLNAFVGYRFPRRHAEVRLGVLNITDQDYRLNPLNLHLELPRHRTFVARLRLTF